ncbi:small-subunit processome [Pilobolus umbonatus]|nr:small-subunit processome [Pilobolus umbonatus]
MARKSDKKRSKKEERELAYDVFEAEEVTDKRKGHDLDQVENLEYDAGEIDEEDDEEIDSDDAFDESDEERFADYKFHEKAHKEGINLDEEESSEDEEEDAYMDISEMLPDTTLAALDQIPDEDSSSEEETDPDMLRFIEKLDKKRRHTDDDHQKSNKRVLKERNETHTENEFNKESSKKLSLADLLVDETLQVDPLKKSKALDAPVAKRIQDRLERQAALATAKEEVTKWEPTVKKNRAAEHLTFNAPDLKVERKSATLVAKFKPETDLEKQISSALASAGMQDKELEEFEALKLNKLTLEEVEERRKELRRMRELMFRHEMKNKRIKKIKSKSYRKLKRKEKEKIVDQIKEIDHEAEDDSMQAALDRAEERMTLKHKNTSKWAKRALARGQLDEGTREALMEQLRRGDELRKKMEGESSENEGDDDLDELRQEVIEDTPSTTGLMAMKFMQDAAKKQVEKNKRDMKALDTMFDEEEEEESGHFSHVQNNPGRMAFGAKAKQVQPPVENEEKEDEEQEQQPKEVKPKKDKRQEYIMVQEEVYTPPPITKPSDPLEDVEVDNPWLQADTSRLAKKSSKNNVSIESRVEHSISKMKKSKKEASAPEVELDMNKVLSVKKNKKKKPSNIIEEEDSVVHKDQIVFSQRDLVSRAFANDDVVSAFEEEKEAEIIEDGDKVEDLTLPGWGSWAGDGVKKQTKKKIVKVVKGVDAKNRKDAKLSHVIISEKKNKKLEKYQSTTIPYPFKNKEQYERSLQTPMGEDWNTSSMFGKLNKPRIITKLGQVIDPLKAPFA